MRLNGRRALITGGASGIGAAIAKRFAGEGARVALLDVNDQGVARVAEATGSTAYCCDLADPLAVATVVPQAIAALGGVDIVVNAAGILAHRPFEDTDVALWQRLFEVNLRGPSLVILAALPALREAISDGADAAIVNISSMNALKPSNGTSAYAATKAGLLALGKNLALELAPIRVNTICPGIVDTAMTAGFMADPGTADRVKAANALHAIGHPEDIAAAAIHLASAEARFTTGAQLVIDGGSSFG